MALYNLNYKLEDEFMYGRSFMSIRDCAIRVLNVMQDFEKLECGINAYDGTNINIFKKTTDPLEIKMLKNYGFRKEE